MFALWSSPYIYIYIPHTGPVKKTSQLRPIYLESTLTTFPLEKGRRKNTILPTRTWTNLNIHPIQNANVVGPPGDDVINPGGSVGTY